MAGVTDQQAVVAFDLVVHAIQRHQHLLAGRILDHRHPLRCETVTPNQYILQLFNILMRCVEYRQTVSKW